MPQRDSFRRRVTSSYRMDPSQGATEGRHPLHPKDASPEDHIPILITSAVLDEAEIARGDATPARDTLAGVRTRVHRKALG